MRQSTVYPFGKVPNRLKGWPAFKWLLKQIVKPHRAHKTNVWYMRLMIVGSSLMMISGLGGVLEPITYVGLGLWFGMLCATPGLFSFVETNRRINLVFKMENHYLRMENRRNGEEAKRLGEAFEKLRLATIAAKP